MSFMTVVAILVVGSRWLQLGSEFSANAVLRIVLPATLIFLLGFFDDIRSINPYAKIAVEVVAGMLLFFGGLRVAQISMHFGARTLGWSLSLLVTVLWVLLITNAFNLIDGLDGLAAGSALFSTLTVFVVSLIQSNGLASILSLTLAGTIIGFLRFNFNPATIFLGDSGSLFIGFTLSALALQGVQQKSSTIVAVAIPIVSLGLPILETALSILRRFLNGQPVFEADREHIHHKLLEMGFSHRSAVVFLYGVSAVCGLLSLFLLHPSEKSLGIVLVVLGTGVWIGIQHLGYHEFFELRRMAYRTMQQRHIIVNNIAIRRAAEKLWKAKDYPELCRILQSTFGQSDFDGFDLCIGPQCTKENHQWGPQACQHYSWQKENMSAATLLEASAPSAGWTLSLTLVRSDHCRSGTFSLSRDGGAGALLIDVNLLTSEFASALSNAAARIMSQSPIQEHVGGRAAARAVGSAG